MTRALVDVGWSSWAVVGHLSELSDHRPRDTEFSIISPARSWHRADIAVR